MDELKRAVVAVEHDGAVLYEYGWAIEVEIEMNRGPDPFEPLGFGPPRYSTAVIWAKPPQRSARYPTDADFAEALPPARVALPTGRLELTAGTWPT